MHVQRAVAGAWEPVSTRLDEGGDFLQAQVGLSPEQFWQVVLLPQGEFAEFLRAEPDQRAKVLETLFDARRFTAVEDWLTEHARATRATLTQAQDTVDRLLHRVEQVARGLPATGRGARMPPRPESEDPDDIRAYLSGQRAAAIAQLIAAAAEDETTRKRLAAAEGGRDRARRALRAIQRLLALCRQRDFLAARSEQVADQRTELSAALAAEPLRPFLDVDSANWKRTDDAAVDLTNVHSNLIRLDVAAQCPVRLRSAARGSDQLELRTISGSGSAGSELRRWNRVLRDEAARLEHLESEWATVTADESMLAVVRERQVSRQASLADLRALSDRLPTALADLEARRDATRLAAAGVEHAAATLTAAQARVEAAARAAALAELLGTAEAEHLAGQREALGAKDRWLSLRENRLAGIAAELAGQLSDGRDCPVCGSLEHPSPAQPADAAVTAQDEHAAADRLDRLEQESARVAARVLELRREYDACCSVTSGATLAAVRKELSAAVTADAAAKAATQLLPELVREYVDLVAGREDVTAQLGRLTEAQAEDRTTAKELTARVGSGHQRLDKARGEDASLTARRVRLSALADAAEAVEQAASVHAGAEAVALHSRGEVADRVQRHGLRSSEAAVAALLDERSRADLIETIREHEDSQTGVSAELTSAAEEADAACVELTELPPGRLTAAPVGVSGQRPMTSAPLTEVVCDLADQVAEVRARLDREHGAAVLARDSAVAALSRARGIGGQLDELQVLLDQALAECAPLLQASVESAALAALVTGGGANVRKMRLRSYVLAARLEQVAAAATARLRQMSGGRFGFVHSDDLRGGNRRSGLSVDILDSHTGTQRPTKTLSGGESFMASLALALGLADVVTAESGGIALDTLFVDEGFGSLDPASLDAVMTVLDELRQGGRVVGIVSHVEELRSRVPMQLEIHTSSHGSTVDQSDVPAAPADRLLAG
ncbi:MAG: hypothetical protein H0T99_00450 [Geodermatophilaceae bacterium]|nr:hypothetical protein [Geodermatophilaceae bacterium]